VDRRRGSAPRNRYSGHGGEDLKDELAAVVTNYLFAGMETLSYGADAVTQVPPVIRRS
jgi:hypothetical protein